MPIRATRGEGYAFIYTPTGKSFITNINLISSSDELSAWWYNPRDGKCYDEQGIQIIEISFKRLNTSENSTNSIHPEIQKEVMIAF